MRRLFMIACSFVLLSLLADPVCDSRNNAIVLAVEKVSSSVVSISLIEKRQRAYYDINEYFDSMMRGKRVPYHIEEETVKIPKVGTGFIIDEKGYVLTNSHVIQDAKEVEVTLPDGRQFPGKVVGNDHFTDIGLVKIDGNKLPVASLGDSEDLKTGEWAIAFGNPFGTAIRNPEPTVTVGVISARNRDFALSRDKRIYRNMIQTDAAINPGNSGGPLVNCKGEVIGINTFIFSQSGGSVGIGFSIPVNRAKKIMAHLRKYGKVERPDFAFDLQALTVDISDLLHYKGNHGVLINYVQRRSLEAKAGLKRGDILLQVNGEKVFDVNDCIMALLEIKSRDTASFLIFRDKKKKTIKIKY